MLIAAREEGDSCRKLPPHQCALVALACLRKLDALPQAATGFGISAGTILSGRTH